MANSPDAIEALKQLLEASGFSCVSKNDTTVNFGAMTVNNLPIVISINYESFSQQVSVVYKYAVPPLKDLSTDCIRFVLTRQAA